jgi:beta-1,2-mannobiose phosphorylase / 1,2-beta-oligomannan phosphorylase
MSTGRSIFQRHPANPIVVPGQQPWRRATVFNPGVIYENGKFYMYERAAGGLRPFICTVGMLESQDGVHFELSRPDPVFTPEMCGSKIGSVQDPRVVKIDDTYYMTFAYRPYAWNSHPTGVGVPQSFQPEVPGWDGNPRNNQTRSGLATSKNLYDWQFHSWITSPEIDDRDVILFPERINGQYVVLRRPLPYVESNHKGPMRGTIQMSFSDDLKTWTAPEVIVEPEFDWENNRIGGSTPPLKTSEGWLVVYHGVETVDASVKTVIYRAGLLMLDLENPRKVIARLPDFVMEPEFYYEKFGTYIPNVVFPTGNVVKDGIVYLYYGCCDTSIGLATAPLQTLVDMVMGRTK